MKRHTALVLACAIGLGCQSAGQRERAASQPTGTEITSQDTETTGDEDAPPRGFSLQRVLQFAGFKKSDEKPATLVPQEIIQLSEIVNSTAARASELSINDPPEVTRQKAQSVLDSLSPWDGVLAAGRSMGLVNDNTARILNAFAGQLKGHAQTLIQHGANAETISAMQQLAGNLQSTFNSVAAIYTEGTAAFQALAGESRVESREPRVAGAAANSRR